MVGQRRQEPSEDEAAEVPFLSIGPNANGRGASGVPSPDLEPGDILEGHFEIKKLIGRGGFATVYLARDLQLEEDFALKVMASWGQTRELIRVLADEYRTQRHIGDMTHILRIERPQIVEHENVGWAVLPMEVADCSLRDWMQAHSGEDRLAEGLDILRQACRGVRAIHEGGLAHLDLKPENILLHRRKSHDGTESWHVNIADFGLARSLEEEILNQSMQGDGVGTPRYMAPEQVFAARDKEVGPPADIYALGVMLFELADGQVPFQGTAEQVRRKHRELEPPAVEPKWINNTVQRCMAKTPAERVGGIDDLLQLLTKDPEEEEEFASAKKTDTIDGWKAFLQKWPDRIREPEAAARLKELEQERAWGERRKSLLGRVHTALRANQLDAAEEALDVLSRHLARRARNDEEYQTLVRSYEEARETEYATWKDRRRKLLDQAVEAIDSNNLDRAAYILSELAEHLGKRANEDSGYQSVRRRLEQEKERRWKERRKQLIETVEGHLTENQLKLARKALGSLEAHLNSSAQSDEAYSRLTRRLARAEAEQARLQELEKQVVAAHQCIDRAAFEEAREALDGIDESLAGHAALKEVHRRLSDCQAQYPGYLKNSQKALERRALAEALRHAEEALQLCPASSPAKEVKRKAEKVQATARQKVKQGFKAIDHAYFLQARSFMDDAKDLSPGFEEIDRLGKRLQSVSRAYEEQRAIANTAREQGKYEEAIAACEEMLRLCTESAGAGRLLESVRKEHDRHKKQQERRRQLFIRAGKWTGGAVLGVLGFFLLRYLGLLFWEWATQTAGPWVAMNPFEVGVFVAVEGAIIAAVLSYLYPGDTTDTFRGSISWVGLSLLAGAGLMGAVTVLVLEGAFLTGVSVGLLLVGLLMPLVFVDPIRTRLGSYFRRLGADLEIRGIRGYQILERTATSASIGLVIVGGALGYVGETGVKGLGTFSAMPTLAAPEGIIITERGSDLATGAPIEIRASRAATNEVVISVVLGDGSPTGTEQRFSPQTTISDLWMSEYEGQTLACFHAKDQRWSVYYCWDYSNDELYFHSTEKNSGDTRFSDNVGADTTLRDLLHGE